MTTTVIIQSNRSNQEDVMVGAISENGEATTDTGLTVGENRTFHVHCGNSLSVSEDEKDIEAM
jgi:hypothetical protein